MARLAIRMPKMSMTMTEGDVSSWMVGVGDEIEVGDVVAEVMTDKVDMEVESPVAGTLVEIVHESGTVEVGAPIGWVEGEDEGGGFGDLLSEPDAEPDAEPDDTADDTADPEPEPEPEPEPAPAAEAPADTEPDDQPDDQPVDQPDEQEVVERAPEPEPSAAKVQPEPEPAPEPEPSPEPSPQGIVPAVPRARALAREKGLDLATIAGTGPDGLVRVEDVESASGPGRAAATSAPAATLAATPAATPVPARSGGAASDRRTAVRRMVARVMTPSAAVPQFTVWREIHLDAADRRRDGVSWTTVLLRGYAAALRNVPELLSRWEDDAPSETRAPSIALAVATERGLLVPTFAEPDREGASDLDAEVRAVVAAAQRGKIDPAYMGIANASLSNLGGSNVDRFQALLTPPQASVLSLGSIRQRPVAIPGGVGVALTVEAGLTVDHRVADGAHAAQLLEELARILGGQGADAS